MSSVNDTSIVNSSGGLVELGVATSGSQITVAAGANTSLASSTAITGPVTAVCDGSPVIVEFFVPFVQPSGSAAGNYIGFSVYVDGVFSGFLGTVMTPSASGLQCPVRLVWRATPSAGVHTFEVRAARDSGGGTAIINGSNAGGWASSMTRVSKVLTAAQYPVQIPGAIFVCTSTTRPASPTAGQRIYETDTGLAYMYTGSAWIREVNADPSTALIPHSLMPSGSIVQVGTYQWTVETSVNNQSAGWVTATSSSYSFTPRFSTSTILIQFEWAMAPYYPSGNYAGMSCRGLWGGTAVTTQTDAGHEAYVSVGPSAPADLYTRTVKSASFTANTTSPVAITTQVRAYAATTNARVNQATNWPSRYTVWEIKA